MCGVYPVADALDAGQQISSTYEGRHVTLLESELIHPVHPADALVDKGDPVVLGAGRGVGIAFKSALADTDLIATDTEGIWVVDVVAVDDNGDSDVVDTDPLFINKNTGVVSKIRNLVTQLHFGYALGHIDGGDIKTIAVKVHWNPNEEQDIFVVFADGHGDDNAKSIKVTDEDDNTGGMSRGLAIDYTTTADKSGTAQVNGLSIDMAIGGNCPDVMPLTIYIATVDDKTIGNYFGLSMYFEDFGNDVANFCALDIGYNSPHAPAGRNAFMRLRQHNTVQAGSAVMLLEGNSAAAFLFRADVAVNCVPTNTHSIDGHALQNLVLVEIQGNTGYIPVFDAVPA